MYIYIYIKYVSNNVFCAISSSHAGMNYISARSIHSTCYIVSCYNIDIDILSTCIYIFCNRNIINNTNYIYVNMYIYTHHIYIYYRSR